jgi:hypothetical protein
MPGPTEAVASSRAKLYLVPPAAGADPIFLGLVEDVSFDKQIRVENIAEIGTGIVRQNVSNLEEGRVRWGKVHQVDPTTARVLYPQISRWTEYQPFAILLLDPVTNGPIAMAIDVRAETGTFMVRGGSAMRQNFTGICRYVLLDDEVKEAAAA